MPQADLSSTYQTHCILLVEDEALIAMAQAELLKRNAYQVLTVYNGEAAVEKALNEDVDLILMDIDLGRGKMDGTEAAQKILASREIPIIFLTSHSEKEMVERVRGITRFGYVLKNSGEFVLMQSIAMAFELWDQRRHREEALKRSRENEENLRHLNRVLRSLQTVNHLIRTVGNEVELLDMITDTLVDISGYSSAMAVLLESGMPREPFLHAGFGEDFAPMGKLLASSTLPDCMNRALSQEEPIVVIDRGVQCENCPLVNRLPGNCGMAGVIRYENRVFGLLQVSVARDFAMKSEERALFEEITDDLGFALHSLETESERSLIETRFRAISESGVFGLSVGEFSAECSPRFVNRTLADFLRYPVLELTSMDTMGLFALKERDSFEAQLSRLLEGKEDSFQMEGEFIRKDGTPTWGLISAITVKDREAKPQEILILISDISDRKLLGIQYKELFENTTDAIYLMDYDGRMIEVNEAACTTLGYTRDELLSLGIDDVDINFDVEAFQSFWSVPIGSSRVFETTHRCKNGTLIPIEVSGTMFMLGDRKVLYGIARDISSRRRAEELFQLLFQQTEFGIGYYDMEGRVQFYNNLALRYMGMSLEQVEGKTMAEIFGEEEAEIYQKRLSACLESGDTKSYKDKIELPSGTYWFLSLYTRILNKAGEPQGVEIISTDQSKLKASTDTARRKEEILERAEALANIGAWEWDIEHDLWYFSEQWKRIHGVEEDEIDSKQLVQIAHPEDREQIDQAFNASVSSGTSYDIRHRIIRQDSGEIRTIHALGAVSDFSESGEALRLVGVARDISEDVRLVRRLEEAIDEKDNLMRELNHRVKNNLLMVKSLVNLKQAEIGSAVDLSDIEGRIEAIAGLHEILQDSGTLRDIPMQRYISGLVSSSLEGNGPHINLELKIDEGILLPAKKATIVGLIINELVTNAVKHGFGTTAKPAITLELKHEAEGYLLQAANNGSPVPSHIDFENPGTLGLKLVKALSTQLGGEAELLRRPTPCFTIRFPF